MAEITQKLGFDVSQGVTALQSLTTTVDNLNQSLKNLNNTNLNNVSKQLSSLNKTVAAAPKAANAATTSTQKLRTANVELERQLRLNIRSALDTSNSFNKVGQSADRMGSSIRSTITGFLLLRQALRGLRAIRDLLLDAANASREFQQSVAEVQTIAGGATFSTLTDEIRALSIEFGRPVVEQSEAAYQAFSNQVIQTTADMGFLTEANKLAISTVASTADAVNILSSVINSYGLEATDAARISDLLFKTIEEGRIRLGEIANSFGTVAKLAKESGVSIEESLAAIATISKSGITARESLTQLRGITSKLLKPTKLMSEAFAEFGARDGPSAIKAAGSLSELLQQMQKFAERNNTTLVKMFSRIRGGTGALILASDGGKQFNDTLEAITNSAGSAAKALEIINRTDARKSEIAFNKLKVTVIDLGKIAVPVITDVVKGINTIIPDAKTLTIVLGGVAAALGVVAIAGAKVLFTLLAIAGVSLGPIIPVLLAIAAATAATAFALKEVNDEFEAIKAAGLKELQDAQKNSEERVKIEQDKAESLKQSIKEVTAEVESQFAKEIAAAKKTSQALKSEFQTAVDVFIDLREKASKEIGKLAQTSIKISEDAADRIAAGLQKLDDIKFDKSIKGFNSIFTASRKLDRALKTARESREQLARAGLDKDKIRAALDTRQRADQQLRDAEQAAGITENSVLEARAQDARERFTRRNIDADKKQIRDTENLRGDQAAKVKKRFDNQTKSIRDQLEELLELGNPFDAADFPKTAKQIRVETQEIARLSREIADNLSRDVTGGLADVAGIDLDGDQIIQASAELLFGQQKVRGDLQEIIDAAPFQAKVQFEEALEEQELRIDTAVAENQIDKLGVALRKQLQEVATTLSRGGGFFGLSDPFITLRDQIAAGSGEIDAGLSKISEAGVQLRDALVGALAGVEAFDSTQLDVARDKLGGLAADVKEQFVSDDISQQAFDALQKSIEGSQNALNLREAQLKAQEGVLKAVGTDTTTSINNATDAANNLTTTVSKVSPEVAKIGSTAAAQIGQINSVAAAWRIVAQEARAAAQAGAGAGAVPAFFGKRIHRQTGGFTRGQDRILTSTAPGEFIMNASSTRKFRSELTAMNANQAPQFRETGGAVTNVGDINVNIQTQDASVISGRDIARELNREIRTRGSKLF